MDMVVGQLELRYAREHEIQLLLTACPLVVFGDQLPVPANRAYTRLPARLGEVGRTFSAGGVRCSAGRLGGKEAGR